MLGVEQNNMTTPQNEITDGNTTQAGTIGSGGAGGAGTAGGIMTGEETPKHTTLQVSRRFRNRLRPNVLPSSHSLFSIIQQLSAAQPFQ